MKPLWSVSLRRLSLCLGALCCAPYLNLAGGLQVLAQEPKPVSPVSIAPASNSQTVASAKIMRDYKGIRLGMPRAEVQAKLGKSELKQNDKDRFVIKGDDRLTVYYDGDQVKAIQLYIIDAKNAPAWTDVIGNAEVMQMNNGAKRARIAVSEEGFWVSMYQSKDGAMTTITISR